MPHRVPSHSAPPWCGQRLRKAKYSPSTLKTPIDRPPSSTIFRSPGGISSTAATTYFTGGEAKCSQSVERARVVEVDHVLRRLGQPWRQGHVGIVGVPVRVVAGEQDVADHVAILLEHLPEVLGPVRLLDGLRREVHVL